uniref:Zeta toxin domain-containing protein n=1 Tax=Alexandrium monilatum TaxID=311494 RepID=A0A7S4RPR5_9DINO
MTSSRQLSRERTGTGERPGTPARDRRVRAEKPGSPSPGPRKPRPPPRGIFALLGFMDDVDRRTNECYRVSRSRFMGCCATVERDPLPAPDGTFPLVPGWTSLADTDAGMEVLEKRSVGIIDASFPTEPVIPPQRRQPVQSAVQTPTTASPTSTSSQSSSVSPTTPVMLMSALPAAAPAAAKEPEEPAPVRQRRAAPGPRATPQDASWTQEAVPPEEPRPRAPVGSHAKPPPQQPQPGFVPAPPPPSPPKPAKEAPKKRDPVAEAAKWAEVEADVEAPARTPSRSRGPQSKMVKYLGGVGKGRRQTVPQGLDEMTQHLVGCHEQDKLLPNVGPVLPPPPAPQTDEILLKGSISDGCGVLRVKTERSHDVFLTYRGGTARWIVVHSTDRNVPLGSTAEYPDSTAAMLQLAELQLARPTWTSVISDLEVAEAIATAELRVSFTIDKLFQGVTAPKQLVILFGPPGSGKTSAALAKPELHYKGSVRIIQDEVVKGLSEHLFRKLVEGRPLARMDPFEKEAFLIEALSLSQRFSEVANKVLWKGERNAFNEALNKGVGVVVESMGASLATLRPAVEAARAKGYRIVALFCQAPGAELRRRCESRIDKELTSGVMLGSRRFDAFLDHLADAAAETWPDLAALCDDARIVRFVEQDLLLGHSDLVLRGHTSERCGVVQVRTPESKEVHLTYHPSTGRWLVVFSTAEDVPLGCTASYPDSTAALVGRTELRLRRPIWRPVLTDWEVQEAVARVKQKLHMMVDNLVVGKTAPKQLALLFGPPDCGKTNLAKETPELNYATSVQLVQDEVIRECTIGLFQRLVAGRPKARTDPFQKEAFLVESLCLYNSFLDIGSQVIWRGRDNALAKALSRGVGVVAESLGASLDGLKPMAAAARESGYSVIGIFPMASGSELRRRCEARFDRELETGRMLGGRHFDAYVDLLTEVAERTWPELGPLCDDAHVVEGHVGPAPPGSGDDRPPAPPPLPPPAVPPNLHEETDPLTLTPRSLPTHGRDVVDFEMVLSDLEDVEALAYSEAFYLFATSKGVAGALDSPLLKEFVLLNSCIRGDDIDAKLLEAAPDMQMTPVKLIDLLRNHSCEDEPAVKLFMEASESGEFAPSEACRKALPALALGQQGAASMPGARRLNRERWERVLDAIMQTAGERVDLQQWLGYWRATARTLRLLHWANL